MPPRPVLLALLLLATAPPFVAQASGSVVGSFTMFNQLERYHLDLAIRTPNGEQPVRLRTLAPHLSQQAKYILLPAEGYAVGADQVDLTVAGLPDLARLLCELHDEALVGRARLVRDPFDVRRSSQSEATIDCRAPR